MQRQAVERVAIERSTLIHCLEIAAEKFRENAKVLRTVETDTVLMTRNAAQLLAGEFDRYELEANELREAIEQAARVEMVADIEEHALCRNCGADIEAPVLFRDNYLRTYCSDHCRRTMPKREGGAI